MQRLMLLHDVSRPGSPVLTSHVAFEIRGTLDEAAFHSAWRDLVARHSALRTEFRWREGTRPVQAVRATADLPLETADFRTQDSSERERQLRAWLGSRTRRVIDVERAPLMQIALARVADGEYRFVWSCHHLVADRWCLDLVVRELAELYAARLDGRPPRLAAPGQFSEYITWVEQQSRSEAEAYWRAALRGFRDPAGLVHRPAVERSVTPRRESRSIHVGASIPDRLRAYARDHRLTFGSVLLGGIGLWLGAATRRADVVVGLTVSGRPAELPRSMDTVGCFINNIPIRLRLPSDAVVGEWLERVHHAQGRRRRHEWVGASQIRAWCDVPPESSLFDVLVLLDTGTAASPSWPDLSMQPLPGSVSAAYPLMIAVDDASGALRLTANYDQSLFDDGKIAHLLTKLQHTLSAVADRPNGRLCDVVSLPESPPSARRPARAVAGANAGSEEPPDGLRRIWAEILGVEVGLDNELFALGLTSIQAAQGFVEIERRLGRRLPMSTLFTAGSVRQILAALNEPAQSAPRLVELQPHGSRPQLFVVPGECGDVISMAGLARVLGPEQPFYGLQSRGLDGHEPPLTHVSDIGADFCAEIETVAREPFVVVGLASGCAATIDVAQRLVAAGGPPALLILVNPPSFDRRVPRLRQWARFVAERMAFHWTSFMEAGSATQRMSYLRHTVQRLAGRARPTARGNDGSRLLRSRARVQVANREAAERYRPRRPYRRDVTVLVTSEDRHRALTSDPSCWLETLLPLASVQLIRDIEQHAEVALEVGADPLTAHNLAVFGEALQALVDGVNRRES